VKKYAKVPGVSFGDVNLSEQQVRDYEGESQSPGAGGWPTVRYFNADCPKGCPYTKKTSDAMCTELGNDDYMEGYVEEAGGVTLCGKGSTEGCDERGKGYLEKWLAKDAADIASQLARLEGMKSGKMTPDLKKWLNMRIGILKSLSRDEL
jgi:hypothetical protein